MNKIATRLLLAAAILMAAMVSLPAEAACYECTYVWFNGHTCDPYLEEGDSGKTDCNDTGPGCALVGAVCSASDGGGGCEGEDCEPLEKNFLETGTNLRLAAVMSESSPRGQVPSCRYVID